MMRKQDDLSSAHLSSNLTEFYSHRKVGGGGGGVAVFNLFQEHIQGTRKNGVPIEIHVVLVRYQLSHPH
jgi:hypothetical protein